MQKLRFRLFALAALLVCALVMALSGDAYSIDPRQWGAGNEQEIRQGHHIEWQRASFRRADGYIVVAWSDTRLGNRDVYAQMISPAGAARFGRRTACRCAPSPSIARKTPKSWPSTTPRATRTTGS